MYPLVRDAAPTLVSFWVIVMLDYIKTITHGDKNPIIMHWAMK